MAIKINLLPKKNNSKFKIKLLVVLGFISVILVGIFGCEKNNKGSSGEGEKSIYNLARAAYDRCVNRAILRSCVADTDYRFTNTCISNPEESRVKSSIIFCMKVYSNPIRSIYFQCVMRNNLSFNFNYCSRERFLSEYFNGYLSTFRGEQIEALIDQFNQVQYGGVYRWRASEVRASGPL